MESRHYSPSDLLHMRRTALVKGTTARIHALLSKVPELDGISCKAAERPSNSRLPRIPKEIRELSTDSNESVRGKKHVASRQLDGTDSEWKYRGRTESEDVESQPISAPAGLVAQKDEGFQRFYRAVASPTHVRVTAGGRIVPNTRASVSPITKWTKDRTGTDGAFARPQQTRGHFEQPPYSMMPGHPFGVFPAMFPSMQGNMAHGMAPGPPAFPMMPWPMAMNVHGAYPYAMPPPPQPDDNRGERRTDNQADTGSVYPQPPRGPPADNYPRPVYCNGQWLMPTGGSSFSYPMTPAPNYPSAPYGVPMVYPPGMHMPPTNRPAGTKTASSDEAGVDLPSSALRGLNLGAQTHPPRSSIRPSEITKRHLGILRSRLKYLEDQLNFNKHQIDEKAVEADARTVRQYIDQFKTNLEVQRSVEDERYPPPASKSDGRPRSPSQGSHDKSSARLPRTSDKQARRDNRGSSDSDPKPGVSTTRFGTGINSTKSTSAFAGWQPPVNSPAGGFEHFNAKASLPVTAAMAAPFQPRVDAPHMATKSATAATPYLRGRVPEGVDPSSVKDTDYVYDRALTSDELRARHMYWGQAPAELQQGLPKFNGKDFFRTSPGRQDAKPVISSDPFEDLSQTATVLTRNGPGFSTQSESLPRPGQGSSEDHEELTVTTNRTNANSTRIGRSMEELNRGSHDTPPTSSGSVREKSSAEETTDDDREILYTGRKNMVKICQRMLPNVIKNSTGSNASISSTTAQGLLPNYSGHATASLTPSITNKMFSNLRNTSKIGLDEARLAGVTTTKSGENCAPSINVDDIF